MLSSWPKAAQLRNAKETLGSSKRGETILLGRVKEVAMECQNAWRNSLCPVQGQGAAQPRH